MFACKTTIQTVKQNANVRLHNEREFRSTTSATKALNLMLIIRFSLEIIKVFAVSAFV